MEYLFPNPSPYEIDDYSFVNLSFNATYSLDQNLQFCENQKFQMIEKREFYILQTNLFIFFIIFFIKFNNMNLCNYYLSNDYMNN
jgi:hypothetical protein